MMQKHHVCTDCLIMQMYHVCLIMQVHHVCIHCLIMQMHHQMDHVCTDCLIMQMHHVCIDCLMMQMHHVCIECLPELRGAFQAVLGPWDWGSHCSTVAWEWSSQEAGSTCLC